MGERFVPGVAQGPLEPGSYDELASVGAAFEGLFYE